MKRSKIILGATTALLAVVGVVSAKAHQFFTPKSNCYYDRGFGYTELVSGKYYVTGTTPVCVTQFNTPSSAKYYLTPHNSQ